MSVELLERALDALGPLADEVVFVGGATVPLHVIESGATNFRPTVDVDGVIQAATRSQYERFAERLRERGLSEDSSSRVICRWRQVAPDLILDIMPDAERVFGFGNRWYSDVVEHPVVTELLSGRSIRHSSAGALIAMKLEAFADRGRRDPLISHDLEDIIRVFDSRPEIEADIAAVSREMRDYIRETLTSLLADPRARDSIPMLMLPASTSELRAAQIVVPRMERVCQ
jgi:hypothetical protein